MAHLATGFSGRTMTITEWSRDSRNYWGFTPDRIRQRLAAGYSIEQALCLPKRIQKKWWHPNKDVRRIARNPHLSLTMLARVSGRSVDECREIVCHD